MELTTNGETQWKTRAAGDTERTDRISTETADWPSLPQLAVHVIHGAGDERRLITDSASRSSPTNRRSDGGTTTATCQQTAGRVVGYVAPRRRAGPDQESREGRWLVLRVDLTPSPSTAVYVPKISSVLVGTGLVRRFVAASDQRVFSASSAWVGDDGWSCWSGSHIWQ